MKSAIEIVNKLIEYRETVEKTFKESEAELYYRSQEIIDLNHALEIRKLNAFQGYNMAKQIQENRKARREAKDKLAEIDSLRKLMVRYNNFFKELENVKADIEQTLHTQRKRSYQPRVRPDLFEGA